MGVSLQIIPEEHWNSSILLKVQSNPADSNFKRIEFFFISGSLGEESFQIGSLPKGG